MEKLTANSEETTKAKFLTMLALSMVLFASCDSSSAQNTANLPKETTKNEITVEKALEKLTFGKTEGFLNNFLKERLKKTGDHEYEGDIRGVHVKAIFREEYFSISFGGTTYNCLKYNETCTKNIFQDMYTETTIGEMVKDFAEALGKVVDLKAELPSKK